MKTSPSPACIVAVVLSLALSACASRGELATSSPAPAQSGQQVAAGTTPAGDAPAATPSDLRQQALEDARRAPAAPLVATAMTQVPQHHAAGPVPAQASGTGVPAQAGQDPVPAVYDPIADPTLPSPVELAAAYDPWERWNRKVHSFNAVVDRSIAKPLAKAYVKVVPRPARLGVSNFFNNLSQPLSAVNNLLQGHPLKAGVSLGRFAINSVFGLGGLFDPATRMQVPSHNEDFGQTLGVWGWKNSRYVELPLFGPRTVRDTFGLVGDAPLAPLQYVEEDKVRVFLQGLQLVDVRTQLMALDSMLEGATDEYALVRDGWLQRRNYQINQDRDTGQNSDANALPDYLRDDEDNPTVPVDVMPYVPDITVP